jgi:phage major head subunit gpT-like protein
MGKIRVPMQMLGAEILAAENAEDRRFKLKWYTGATVPRYSDEGSYKLTLSMEPKHIRMGRLQSGKAPLLNSHSSVDLSNVIGVIESADTDGNAVARMSPRAEVTPFWEDVQAGIIRNASVGAHIHKLQDVSKKDKEGNVLERAYLATDWEPMEVSLVPIGADPKAGMSANLEDKERFTEAEIVSVSFTGASARLETTMKKEDTALAGQEARAKKEEEEKLAAEAAEAERKRIIEAGIAKERARVQSINATVKALGLPQSFASKHIEDGTDADVFNRLAIDESVRLKQIEGDRTGPQIPGAEILSDEADNRRSGMIGAFLNRWNEGSFTFDEKNREFVFDKNKKAKLWEGSRPYMGLSLLDCAKECLTAKGIRWQSKNQSEIVSLAFQSTSDFPYILADSANKTLRAGYDMAPSPWKMISAQRSAKDFKSQYELTLDSSVRLGKVPESGEYVRGYLTEGRESWKIAPYGQIIAVTRTAVINDDLGAFTRIPFLLGQEVAANEADIMISLITDNGALADGQTLFNDTYHKNHVDSGAAISVDTLASTELKMMTQTGPGGKVLALMPKYLLVPAALRKLAIQYTSNEPGVTEAAKVNPYAGSLIPLVEPRLDAAGHTTDWYLFADPMNANGTVLVYSYLAGQAGPVTETRMGFDVDGMEIKVREDFGGGVVDWRGVVKNDGTA